MKLRSTGKTDKQISKYIAKLHNSSYPIGFADKSEVSLDYDLKEALLLASTVREDLKKIGKENLQKIKDIVGKEYRIDTDSPVLTFSDGLGRDEVDFDSVRCAHRVLSTYLAVKKLNDEVEHFRKLNLLEKIL